MLTLTGPGGIGKTRLAIAAAHELQSDFPDGVVFVNLAPLNDPDLVLPALAATLNLQERGGQPLLTILSQVLAKKRLLLVLDNFEHLVDAAPAVASLLGAAASVTLLVTSRLPLHLSGEHVYQVPPLDLPDPAQLSDHGRHLECEAIRLFIQRAAAAASSFVVTAENAATITAICQRLDGLPLAIELAAARVRALPLPALLQRLERRLPLLTGGARDLPARQQTLRNTIAWSYDLLSEDEQALFRRLSVFRGGWTLEAAECSRYSKRHGAEGQLCLLKKPLPTRLPLPRSDHLPADWRLPSPFTLGRCWEFGIRRAPAVRSAAGV